MSGTPHEAKRPRLEPCPFCGGEAHVRELRTCDFIMYSMSCETPRCYGFESQVWFSTPDAAAEAWNRRAGRTCQMSVADNGAYRCSECGHLQDDTYRSDKGWYPPEYCAHCGARVMSE